MLEDNPFFLDAREGRRRDLARAGARTSASAGRCCAARASTSTCGARSRISSYQDFDFRVPVETAGDCYARYRVRMVEFRESIRIVRQALDGLPEGPISSRPGAEIASRRSRCRRARPTRASRGRAARSAATSIADGSAKPYRMKWRGASFSNLAVLPHIIPGHKVADVVAIMGSVDPVFGEVDR